MEASATVEDCAMKFEQEFSRVSIDSSVGSSVFENVSVVYNGASRHMNRVYDFFKMITTLGSGHFI